MTDERHALIEAVRDFASAALGPRAAPWGAAQAGEPGLAGVDISEEIGDARLTRLSAVEITRLIVGRSLLGAR